MEAATPTPTSLHLLQKRIPKIPTNIKNIGHGSTTSIPKSSTITAKLNSIFAPLNLSMLQTGKSDNKIPINQQSSKLDVLILKSLLKQNPNNPTLLLKYNSALEKQQFSTKSHNQLSLQLPNVPVTAEKDKIGSKLHTLNKIYHKVEVLEASMKLKKKQWMYRSNNRDSIKQKWKNNIIKREKRRRKFGLKSTGTDEQDDGATTNSSSVKGEKPRYSVLTLKRRMKIRPGVIFRSNKTKQKYVFTPAQRTIPESELALLAAGYALRFSAGQSHDINSSDASHENENVTQNHHVETESFENTENVAINMDCETVNSTSTSTDEDENSNNLVSVNRYADNTSTSSVNNFRELTLMDHTLQLIAYGKELKKRMLLLNNDGIMLDGESRRPLLKLYDRPPMIRNPIPTITVETSSLNTTLDQAVCNILAHAGFTRATLDSLELLTGALELFYESFCKSLKNAVEKEVVDMSHGFLDPFDRVIHEHGLSINGLINYFSWDVIGYNSTIEEWVDKLETKFGNLISTKVCNLQLTRTNQKGTVDGGTAIATGAYLRSWKYTSTGITQSSHQTNERDFLTNSRHNSTETIDFNLQIDSIPSLSSSI